MLKKYIFKHDILLKHYGIFWIQIKYKKYNLVDCIFGKWYNPEFDTCEIKKWLQTQ